MANFPLANGIAGALTVADKKQALESFLAATKQLPGGAAETVLAIAAGVITPTRAAHAVDTEGSAAADDLTHIALDNLPDGSLLELRCQDPSREVIVRHQAGGVGQILLAGGADFTLDTLDKYIRLQRRGTEWRERGRYVDIGDFATAVHGHEIDDLVGLGEALDNKEPANPAILKSDTHADLTVGFRAGTTGATGVSGVFQPTYHNGNVRRFNLTGNSTLAFVSGNFGTHVYLVDRSESNFTLSLSGFDKVVGAVGGRYALVTVIAVDGRQTAFIDDVS